MAVMSEVKGRMREEGWCSCVCFVFFFQAEDGIRDFCLSRGLGDVYKEQTQALRYLGPFFPLSGGCFPVLGAPQSPRLIAPSDILGFHSVFCVVFVFPGRFLRKNKAWRSRVSVHSLCTYMYLHGGAQKANSTRCFLWCSLLLGRFPRKNQAWLSLRPIGSSWDDPGAPSHLCRIAIYSG